MHDELEELTASGLPPQRVLRMATLDAATFLGRADWGRVAEGAQADLLLLRGNPLDRISNTRTIDGVVLQGAWMSKRELDSLAPR